MIMINSLKISLITTLLVVVIPFSSIVNKDKEITITCFGDSITEGQTGWSNDDTKYPVDDLASQYEYYLFKTLNNEIIPTVKRIQVEDGLWITKLEQINARYKLYNAGHGGYTIDRLIDRVKYDVKPYKPQFTIVLAGVNDISGGDTVDSITQSLAQLYVEIRKAGSIPILATITPVNKWQVDGTSPNIAKLDKINEVNAWIRGYAKTNRYLLIDFYKVMEDATMPGYVSSIDDADGIHLTVAGYKHMSQAIKKDTFKNTKESSGIKQ